ncbi:MAG TPA: hypothetical protein VIV11_13710, partial [Kofleriaceae bacterium]
MRTSLLLVIVAAGCGTHRPPEPLSSVANRGSETPLVALTRYQSVESYCTSLRTLPPASSDADAEPLQPGCTSFPAWGTKANPTTRHRLDGTFAEARVITIITRRGDYGCALALRDRRGWSIGESAIDTCNLTPDPSGDAADGNDSNGGWMRQHGEYLAIMSVHRDTQCGGCDDSIDVRIEKLTLCKADDAGEARCTAPIEIIHYGADIRFRTWNLTGNVLELSPWWNGHEED